MMMLILRRAFLPILASVLFVSLGQTPSLAEETAEPRPEISGDPNKPRRHFRVRDAADLGKEESENIYRGLLTFLPEAHRITP